MLRASLLLVLWGCTMTTLSAAEKSEDERLAGLFQEYLEALFKQKPVSATQFGDHRYDHLLDDISAPARANWVLLAKQTQEKLTKQLDPKKLTRPGQIDLEIFQHNLKYNLWQAENTKPFETDPRVYLEYLSDSVYLLLTQSSLAKETNLKNAVQRIKQIPRIVEVAKITLKNPPKVVLETAIKQTKGAISFYESGIYQISGETPELSELRPACREVLPSLKDFLAHLETKVLPNAEGNWRSGKEKFAQKLLLELDAGLTADEVLKEAEAEADRVEREMYVIAKQLWAKAFPKKPLPPDDAQGRRSTVAMVVAYTSQEHGKADSLVQDAKASVNKIKQFITEQGILKLPDPDKCQIVEMPEFQRGNSVAYLNPAAPLDAKANSYYAVSPPPREWDTRKVQSFLQEYNRHMLQMLTIHEAYPGHYVQLEYSNRHPSLIRRVLQSGVFAEGWAVYTEQMMLDQGYGDGDLALRLSQLKWYLRAVTNAILDHKMHCGSMTDEEALELLTQRAFQSEGEALGKIVRSKQSFCQLSTYFVGRTAFYRLRQQIEREQGDAFNLAKYHEAVLSQGTLPVKYLPELVRQALKK